MAMNYTCDQRFPDVAYISIITFAVAAVEIHRRILTRRNR